MKNKWFDSRGWFNRTVGLMVACATLVPTQLALAERDCGSDIVIGTSTNRFTRVRLPQPSGSFPVGYLESVVIDRTRTDALNPRPDQPRRLPIGFWYPSSLSCSMRRRYVTDVQESVALNAVGQGDQVGVGDYIETNASNDTPVARGSFPVILFSPGFGSPFQNYQVLAEQLASYGYVVVGINHPAISGVLMIDGDLRTSPADFPVDQSETLSQWAVGDVQAVLEQIKDGRALPSIALGKSLNLNRIGIFGHSFGGSTAIRAAGFMPEIRASVDLDGTIWGEIDPSKLKTQAMIVRTGLSAQYEPTMENVWTNLSQRSLLITMPQTEHATFGDFYFITKVATGQAADIPDIGYGRNTTANLLVIRNLLVHYFNVTLKERPASIVDKYLTIAFSKGYVSEFRYNR